MPPSRHRVHATRPLRPPAPGPDGLWSGIGPHEADPPLAIEPDAVLTNRSLWRASSRLPRRNAKVHECLGCILGPPGGDGAGQIGGRTWQSSQRRSGVSAPAVIPAVSDDRPTHASRDALGAVLLGSSQRSGVSEPASNGSGRPRVPHGSAHRPWIIGTRQ